MTADDIYTIAGDPQQSGNTGDGGAGTSATLNSPAGIALDATGNLYIADNGNNQVQEVAGLHRHPVGPVDDRRRHLHHRRQHVGHLRPHRRRRPGHLGELLNPDGPVFDRRPATFTSPTPATTASRRSPAASGTQWGQSMTADDIYTVAGELGRIVGLQRQRRRGHLGQVQLSSRAGFDSAGDLYIADQTTTVAHGRRRQLSRSSPGPATPATSSPGTPATPTARRRRGSGSSECGLNNAVGRGASTRPATSTSPTTPTTASRRSRPRRGTQWGQSMTAGDIYTVAGQLAGSSGHTGDGGAATSAELDGPVGVALDSSGDLYIADHRTTASRRSPSPRAPSGASR